MNIGPRDEVEAAFDAKLQKAADALKKKFARDEDVQILVIAKRGDGITINATCCMACALEAATNAADKLSEMLEENDRRSAELN